MQTKQFCLHANLIIDGSYEIIMKESMHMGGRED